MSIQSALKTHFGYTSFRPLQEEIIQAALKGQDTFALLPTGGGKSLCFQLPALTQKGLTLVVSPLISLMKDQVDSLKANGIAATFLNSTLSEKENNKRLSNLHNGKYKLLYVAPERLMMPIFLETLQHWDVDLIAIDEAHCISEWGHDFRPEYRKLASLRSFFPEIPIMALTATATERVREDILKQLQLKDPKVFVASFNRPNLSYKVLPKEKPLPQVLEIIQDHPKSSGIIYCQSRRQTEELAKELTSRGVLAKAYHAGLDARVRAKNQDLFIRDEIQVVCATIAFGMGINKSNVRFVIHYDLAKNIEGYYQETGRAGRDGLSSQCYLMFRPGDSAKISRFIAMKPSEQERNVAHRQLDQIVGYAETGECRRAHLLSYFGEEWDKGNCQSCDNCLTPKETFDATVATQKFLSCLFRIKEKNGFLVGANHIVTVLTGGETEKVHQWGHETLSTYGIGHEFKRNEWKAIARELIRKGYLLEKVDQFNVLDITEKGWAALKEKQPITLTKPYVYKSKKKPTFKDSGPMDSDADLFERLRVLRKKLADERDVPAYIVFSDASLRHMASDKPKTEDEFAQISGVGARKLGEFGEAFISEIKQYLEESTPVATAQA